LPSIAALPTTYKDDYSKIPSNTIQTNNLQLNQLPDYFIVVVRKAMNKQTITDSSTFLAIDNV